MKYAFDNQWIGEMGRVILGLLAGVAFFVGAEFARHKKYDVMAQGLHGTGAAILYLSIFAAFGLYKLIGVVPTFAFLSAVAAFSAFWAVRTNWMSAAVIGICGAFLTLAVIGTKSLPFGAVYGYVAIVDLGVLAISLKRNWRVLNLISFGLSHVVFGTMMGAAGHLTENVIFVVALFAIFCALSIAHNLIRRQASDRLDLLLVVANGLLACAELSQILKPYAGPFPGLLPLAFATVYLGYSYHALRRRADDKSLVLIYVGMALTFVTVTVPAQLNGQWMTVAWACEALLLLWLSFRTSIPKLRPWALGIGLLSVGSLLSQAYQHKAYQLAEIRQILNADTLTAALVAACMFTAAAIYAKNRESVPQAERSMVSALVIGASLLILYRGSAEIFIFFSNLAQSQVAFDASQELHQRRAALWMAYQHLFQPRQMVLSAFWILFALASVAIGIYRRFRALRLMGLLLFGVAVLKIFMIDLSQLDRIYRILSFLILGAVLLVTSFFYQRYKERIRDFALKD